MSTYKFGAYDLNLENYIKTLRTNINTYLEQDPDTENWSRKDRERFVEAYNQYISGLQNQLDTGNVNFQTGDTGSLHDMYGVFTNEKAARRVASYANKMGQETVKKLNSKQEPQQEKIPTFEDYVKTTYNVDKSWNELDYLAKDEEEDENGVRGIKKRSDFLQKAINDYKSKYADSPYNIELTNLYNALNNGFNTEAITAANKAGLTEEFYRSLFETKYDKSLETIKKEREAKQKQEQQQAVTDKYNTWLSEQDALYNTNINGKTSLVINNDYLDKYPDVYKDGKFDARAARKAIIDKYSAENPSDSNLQENKLFKKAIFSYLDQLMRGESTGIDKIVLDLFDYGEGFDKVKFNGEEYWLLNIDPYYSDLYNQNLFFGYNKTDGTVGYGHLEWWTTKWSEKVNEWKQQNSGDRAKPALTFKQGGEDFKFQNSGKVIRRGKTINFDELFEEDRKKSIEKQTKENKTNKKKENSWRDVLKFGYQLGDYTTSSQLGYNPALSIASNIVNTISDAIIDGVVYDEPTKNLSTNINSTLLEAIPGLGTFLKRRRARNQMKRSIKSIYPYLLNWSKDDLKDILEKYEIPYEKQGGTLERVRKFQSGGQTWRKKPNYLNIEDIESNANNINTWDSYYKTNDIYSDLKKNPLQIDSKVFLDTVNQLNDLNLDFTKEINKKGFVAWNTLFDNLGLNSRYFGSDSAKFDYLGPTTYNRNVILQGLKDIYTKESPLKTTDNKNIYHDGNKWVSEDVPSTWKHTYLDRIHERYGDDQKPLMVNDQKSWMPFGITGKELAIQEDSKEKSETYDPFEEKFKEKRFNIFDKLFKENTLLTHALPRAFYADKVNKKLRDMAIANEKAYLKDPFQYNRYVTGDLGRLAYGDKQAGELYSWANTATNSDASLQTAKSLDARLKALDAKYQAFNEDNQAIKTSMEQAWSQQKENALNAHQTAQDNMKSLLQSDANKNVYNMAYENKKHETFDTLWQQFEHLTQRKLNEIKNYQKQFDDFYMGSYVDNNLGKLNPNLSPEAVAIYQNVRNGSKKRSELTADEEQLFKLAVNAADQTKYRIAGERYGFKPSFISKSKIDPNFVIHVKNGGSIKERIANAERLYKTIKDKHDENEKKLNRLFKSLYTLKNKNK